MIVKGPVSVKFGEVITVTTRSGEPTGPSVTDCVFEGPFDDECGIFFDVDEQGRTLGVRVVGLKISKAVP